jgi:nucleotide-binding universal stress UspA family protein
VTPLRAILFPTDFSEKAEVAFPLACSLARDHGATLVILHVARFDPLFIEGAMMPMPSPGYRGELESKLRELRPEILGVRAEYHLVEGHPAVEINRLAKEYPCDLIVMGTHGRTGLGRLLMGSIAEEVVRKGPCPVLTVKEPFAMAGEPAARKEEARC